MFALTLSKSTNGSNNCFFFIVLESRDDILESDITNVPVSVGIGFANHLNQLFFTHILSQLYLTHKIPLSTFRNICLDNIELPSVLYDLNFS